MSSKQKQKKPQMPEEPRPLVPGEFYRRSENWKYYGYRPTQLEEKIKSGEIPPPISLSDTGRACGWFGRTIIAWQQEREAASKVEA
jgi:predicted DNA-binding transcriptional regulator AlpA